MNSYSLRLLFVVVTVAATMAAALGGLLEADLAFVGIGLVIISALACGTAGAAIGVVVGLHDFNRSRGVLLGVSVGCLVGILISPLVFIEVDAASRIFAAQLAGALVLVALGISARLAQK